MTDQPTSTPWSATPDELTERFLWMLDQCDRYGWRHLAELVGAQLEKLYGDSNG